MAYRRIDTDLESQEEERQTEQSNLTSSLLNPPEASKPKGIDRLARELDKKVDLARAIWTKKITDLRVQLQIPDIERQLNIKRYPRSIFQLLLALHCYEPVLEELEDAYEMDPPAIAFYVPQLCTFLLYGCYDSAGLEAFLLDKCSRNVHFAHRMWWFLRSWGEKSSEEMHVTERDLIRNLIKQVERRGEGPACLLQVGQGPGESTNTTSISHSLFGSPVTPERYDHSVHRSYQNPDYAPPSPPTIFTPSNDLSLLPVDPKTKRPCKRHVDSVLATHRIGFFPVNSLGDTGDPSSCFAAAPNFLQKLIDIADDLFPVAKDQRTSSLRQMLCDLEISHLPSNVIYIPVQSSTHRVWRIVPEESIALSTKERVPCIITLEVVDYGDISGDDERLASWWKTPRHPQRHNTFLDKFERVTERVTGRITNAFERNEDLDLEASIIPPPTNNKFRAKSAIKSIPKPMANVLECDERVGEAKETAAAASSFGSARSLSSDTGNGGMKRNDSAMDLLIMGQWKSPSRPSASSNASTSQQLRQRLASEDVNSDRNAASSVLHASSGSNRSNASTGSGITPPVIFKESWSQKEDRIRPTSCYGRMPGWKLMPVFVKSNDDLRQEQLASQLIKQMSQILCDARVPVWLYPYEILSITPRAGVIEAVSDSISIDSLKRNYRGYTTMKNFFEDHFGPAGTDAHAGAKANFVESMAAYSVVCYLLQIKDRHNGNILMTKSGHIVHIDFGFMFLSSPGKGMGFETAPFKLTRETVEMMDGPGSRTFHRFRELCVRTFMELRKNAHMIILLVEMLVGGNEDLPCFDGRPDVAVLELRSRFKLDMNDNACRAYVDGLVDESLENWRTRWYDRYQRCCQGYR